MSFGTLSFGENRKGIWGDGQTFWNQGPAVLASSTPQYPINTTVDLYSNSNNSNCGGDLIIDTSNFSANIQSPFWVGIQSISWQILMRSHGYVGLYVANLRCNACLSTF